MRNQMFSATLVFALTLSGMCFTMTFGSLQAANLSARGKELFEKRCTGCHALDNEKTGPRLRGVYRRSAARVPSFPYSQSLRKSGITWDNIFLDKWLTDPDGFVPDNDMAFRVANPEKRAAIIDYLKTTGDK
jgi:cytochrome c